MKDTVRLAISIGLIQSINIGMLLPSIADTGKTESVEMSGQVKAFSPKYKERIKTYEGQIDTALSKGWLTPDLGQKFRGRLDELKKMEANTSANGYPKSELDNVDKAFSQFNIDLTAAENAKGEQHANAASHRP